MLNARVIEAVIGLPPKLFYGTGIPAVIVVLNKSISDADRDHVFLINADREFAEGKKQNSLRPEDIEKIVHVFQNRIELDNYSRRVPIAEIGGEAHDWNLNLRRYVDNTPPPEPEDVRCHLLGGVPRAEVNAPAHAAQYAKFGVDPMCAFEPLDGSRLRFRNGITSASEVRRIVEGQPGIAATREKLQSALAVWWKTASHDFATLAPTPAAANGSRLPAVRAALLQKLVATMVPINVLDDFQVRGVFVSWWDGTDEKSIKYDLKTITSIGWAPTLIPEPMVVDRFFAAERDAIYAREQQIAEAEAALAEAVENAQELLEYEPDEDEKVTSALMKEQLAKEIGSEETAENLPLREAEAALKKAEADLKEHKAERDRLTAALELKVEFKLYGPDDRIEELQAALAQAEKELADLGGPLPDAPVRRPRGAPKPTADEKVALKTRKNLAVDVATLKARITEFNTVFAKIGEKISEDESRELILKKHHDLVADQLRRYVQAEERAFFGIFENFLAKYAVGANTLESDRAATMHELDGFLKQLQYS